MISKITVMFKRTLGRVIYQFSSHDMYAGELAPFNMAIQVTLSSCTFVMAHEEDAAD